MELTDVSANNYNKIASDVDVHSVNKCCICSTIALWQEG